MDIIRINNKFFYLEGTLYNDRLCIELFHIEPEFRGQKLSYFIWKNIQNTFKVNIYILAFFTLIPYYKKMGFEDLGESDSEGYHELLLKYNIQK